MPPSPFKNKQKVTKNFQIIKEEQKNEKKKNPTPPTHFPPSRFSSKRSEKKTMAFSPFKS